MLDQLDKDLCDSELTLEECSKALKELANNKSHGPDGLTTNFYNFFWPDIKFMVYESLIQFNSQFNVSRTETRHNKPHS